MFEFNEILERNRYTITVPTYERHFSRFSDLLESINTYCTDKHLLDVIVVIEADNIPHIKATATKFPDIDLKIVTTETALAAFDIKENASSFLSRVGKFTFQSIKKFGGLINAKTDWAIVLDSETLFVKPFSVADLISQYAKNPHIFYTNTDRRGRDWSEGLVDKVIKQCISVMGCEHPGRNYMELIFWIFDSHKIRAYFEKHGAELVAFLSRANPSMPIFENIMIYIFLQNNFEDEYKFIDFEEAWKSTVPEEIGVRFDLEKAPLSFLGADHVTYTLAPSEIPKIAPFFEKYKVPFFRLEPFVISPEYFEEFMKLPQVICFVSSAHIPWLRKRIAICLSGEFRNPPASFVKVRHLAGFLAGCDCDLYLHGWHHPDEAVIVETLKPKAFLFEKVPEQLFSKINAQIAHREPNVRPGRDLGSLAMFYGMERCFELMEASGQDYDFVIRLRPDLYMENALWEILRAISMEGDLNRKSLYVPRSFHSQGINDQVAIGGIDAMRIYMSAYSYTVENLKSLYFNPEWIMLNNILGSDIAIVQFYLNYALMRSENYHHDNISRIIREQHGIWWSAHCLFPAYEQANDFFRDKLRGTQFAIDRAKPLWRLYIDSGIAQPAVLEFNWADLNPSAHLHGGSLRSDHSDFSVSGDWHPVSVANGKFKYGPHVERYVYVWVEDLAYHVVEWSVAHGKFSRKLVTITPNLVKEIHEGEAWAGTFSPTDFTDADAFVENAGVTREDMAPPTPTIGQTDLRESPAPAKVNWRIWSASELQVGDGEAEDDVITLSRQDGLLSYGPYVELPTGGYSARLVFDAMKGNGRFEAKVTSGCGTEVLARHVWCGDSIGYIDLPFFVGDAQNQDIEFVIHNLGFSKISLKNIQLDQADQSYFPFISTKIAAYDKYNHGVVGDIRNRRLYTNGKAGRLIQTDNLELPRGRYVVRLMTDEIVNLGRSSIEVHRSGGWMPVARKQLKNCLYKNDEIFFDFALPKDTSGIFIRVNSDGNSVYSVRHLQVDSISTDI